MTTTFALEKNWWEKVHDVQDIYEFTKYEKGMKRSEAEKFRNIAQYTMLYLTKNVFSSDNIQPGTYYIPPKMSLLYQPFAEKITMNSEISKKPYNPKIMAFTFLYLVNINQDILYSQNVVNECLQMIQKIESKIRNNVRLSAFETSIKDFMKETGMTSENLVRYFVFYKRKFPNLTI